MANLQDVQDLNQLTLDQPDADAELCTTHPALENNDFGEGQEPFTDVVLVVDGYRFHVNKAILATHSPVFRAMFSQDFQEKEKSEVQLPGKAAYPLYQMLGLLYHKKWFGIEGMPEVQDQLKLAREYDIDVLKMECQKFLLGRDDRSIETLLISQEFHLDVLTDACNKSLGQQFTLKELQAHPKYRDIEDKHLVAILTELIETKEEQEGITQNQERMKQEKEKQDEERKKRNENEELHKWKRKIVRQVGDIELSIGTNKSIPRELPKSYEHEHWNFEAGCKICFDALVLHIRDQLDDLTKGLKKIPVEDYMW